MLVASAVPQGRAPPAPISNRAWPSKSWPLWTMKHMEDSQSDSLSTQPQFYVGCTISECK